MAKTPPDNRLPGLEARLAAWLDTLSEAHRGNLKVYAQCILFCNNTAVRKLIAHMVDQWKKRPAKGFMIDILYSTVFNRKFGHKPAEEDKMAAVLESAIALTKEYIVTMPNRTDAVKRGEYLTQHAAMSINKAVFDEAHTEWQQAVEAAPESFGKLYQQANIQRELLAHWSTDRHKKGFQLVIEMNNTHQLYCQIMDIYIQLSKKTCGNLLSESEHTAALQDKSMLLTLGQQLLEAQHETEGLLAIAAQYKQAFKQLGQSEREMVMRILVNLMVGKIHAGHIEFLSHVVDLYKWAIKQSGFTPRWARSDEDFLNIAMAFAWVGDLDDMYVFIKKQAENLPPVLRQQAEALAWAYYYFFKKDFTEAEKWAEKVSKNREITHKLRYHSLRIRLQYCLFCQSDNEEPLETALNAYDAYFERDEGLQNERRGEYMRLGWFIHSLMNMTLRGRTNAAIKHELLKELDNPDKVKPISFNWLKDYLLSL
jgi:hypothetical protein